MLANIVVAGLAFTAPPSLTRRDMLVNFGAAGAAMAPLAAFAGDPSKYAGAADRRKAEKAAAEKAKRGDAKRVRPCVGANWCLSSIAAQAPIACIHNPAAGAEIKFGVGTLTKASQQKKSGCGWGWTSRPSSCPDSE